MKKRIFSVALSLCLALSLLPGTALATDGTGPGIADMSISYDDGTVEKTVSDGSFVFTAPADSNVADYTATLTLSDGAALTATTTPTEGNLYVASATENTATLKFRITVGREEETMDDYSEFDLNLSKTDADTWTGSFNNASILKLSMLSGYLVNKDIQLVSGALGTGSPAQDIVVNEDDVNVMLILCAPDAVVYTVNYVVDENTTITWKLPAGMPMPVPTLELNNGATLNGWYTDSGFSTSLASDAAVTENTTLYAKISGGTQTDQNFLTQLEAHNDVTIEDEADWATFVANADKAVAGQVVTLGKDINCGNATYTSLDFAGNFNGNGHTISYATFETLDNATASGEACSGMFATLGAGQIVANLTLDHITAEYAGEYAGVLVGMADGASNSRALIQNVQVTNSSVSGRTAGGVVGFIRNADVKYCSSRSTTITGLANGGGVGGLNNAHVEFCFSTSTPTALPTLIGGSAGGVIGKSVRGGNSNYCWAYMDVVGATKDGAGQELNSLVASDSMSYQSFKRAGFNQICWSAGTGMPADFNSNIVEYDF